MATDLGLVVRIIPTGRRLFRWEVKRTWEPPAGIVYPSGDPGPLALEESGWAYYRMTRWGAERLRRRFLRRGDRD